MSGGRLAERKNYRLYRDLDDYEWRQQLLDSVAGENTLPMPGFPSEDTQRRFIGGAGTDALWEAWGFYLLMADRSKRHGLQLNAKSYVLDFGCGWGRFARMFLREVPGSHIYLADTWDMALDICRQSGVPGRRVQLPPLPPSPLPTNRVDLAFAYSVFSHLSPMSHLAWRSELSRCIKPGGLAFITTQARWFLDNCRRFREHPEERSHPWHEQLAAAFVDYDAAIAAYDRGEFLFKPQNARPGPTTPQKTRDTSNGNVVEALSPEVYGDAVVPAAYFEAEWCGSMGFELLEFIEDRSVCEQAVAVLRRT